MADDMLKMKVTGLTIDPFTNMPIIILKDYSETMALPIWVGLIEASSIATELEHIELARPMTHDLMKNIFELLETKVLRVEVTDLTDNTFFSSIFLEHRGKTFEIDSRPSDAIALALRTGSDIFVSKRVMEKSRKIDLKQHLDEDTIKAQRWADILENLAPEDFGKYKM